MCIAVNTWLTGHAQFPLDPCYKAGMQHQSSKAAAALLALILEDNELAHARSLLVIHDDMTKSPCSMQHETDSTELNFTMDAGVDRSV